MKKPPTPLQILLERKKTGWSQSKSAEKVHVTPRAWQWWEAGKRTMPIGLWELFLIKAEVHPSYTKKMSNGR